MTLPRITSPHATGANRTQRVMLLVMAACVPGILTLSYFFGIGPLLNIALACGFALLFEAAILALRKRPALFFLKDCSVLVTGLLLALALPPYSPWWLVAVASGFAVVFGKQLFGGLGQNPFNPAMLGYVVVLVSFPADMVLWPAAHSIDVSSGLQLVFSGDQIPDAWSQATVLDVLKNNNSLTLQELWADNPAYGLFAGYSSEWVNLAFLLGGLFLLRKKIFSWHAPVGMLAALFIMSLLFWNGSGSDSNGSPLFHLLSGATMLGAFFIVTDPVSSATSVQGRLIFGVGVGVLIYIIRTWGGYPDGVAFAVLLMNLCAPTIDYFTRPRTYGHQTAKRGFKAGD
ncbi:MAG TPA: RnfABCDGE type electron transport complex subunit D [Thiopseudomonas sp.]|nr:RnfABCDGE type electron transport complex subunit D [Thiopseudomonas sp.]